MGHNNSIISAPVNTDDVSTVLGVASHDVKTLCMSESINKWAKYKPEAQGGPEELTLEARRTNNFGLSPTATYASKATFIAAVANKSFTGGWTYKAIGANAWGRLTDFDGYNDNAVPPFGKIMPYTGILSSNQTAHTEIPCEAPDSGDPTLISIDEFKKPGADYANWYFGILLFHPTNAALRIMATATTKIGASQQWQVDFGYLNPNTYAGTYKAVPFLSSKIFSVGSDVDGATIIGIGSTGIEVELKTSAQTYIPLANCYYPNATTLNVNYLVSIQNKGTTQQTFPTVVLELAKTNTGKDSISFVSFGSITVAAGKTWSSSGVKAVTSREYQFCRLKYSGSSNNDWINFEDLDEDAP